MQDGTATFTAAIIVSGDTLKGFSASATSDTAKFPVLGKARNITQVLRGEDQITVDLFMDDGGPLFPDCLGHYMKVRYKEIGAAAGYKEKIGVVTSYDVDFPDGATTEKLVIMCDANGATAA